MADIVEYNSVTIANIMDRLELYKANPSGIQRVIFEVLEEVTNGEVNIVDPTSPFVFNLEASSVNTALAINETMINLRKQYPVLALEEQELYYHMSDKDFLNRFATPVKTVFTVVIQVDELLNKMVYDPEEKCHKTIIPRDSQFKLDDLVFTLQYPVVIRRFSNGVVQVSYDGTIPSPFQTLKTNIIDYTGRNDSENVSWLFFDLELYQFKIESSTFPLQKGSVFSQNVTFTDQFYYLRAFYKKETNGDWIEFKTTHTDQVFDSNVPTAVVKVYSDSQYVTVFIPTIYLINELLTGQVRFDVYTTKGQITVNLTNYKISAFTLKAMAIDEERDVNAYTNSFLNISHYTYCNQTISGGTNGLTFEQLRERVIMNSVGEQKLPITNVDLESSVNNAGFELVKNIDVLTNRVFLAVQKLPKPINTKLITAANIGISTYITSLEYLKTLSTVKDNTDRITILSNNLFINNNGVISLVEKSGIEQLLLMNKTAMVNQINSNYYSYNPFYYVLDNSQSTGFESRIYNLDYPVASNLSFVSQNQTLQLPVNTGEIEFIKTAEGYRLKVLTKSGNFYKQLADGNVDVQLAYYPVGETDLAYINGTLVDMSATDERIYAFDIVTNYDINQDNLLCITNAKMFNNENTETWINLNHQFHIFYLTDSIPVSYIADDADGLIGKFLLPTGFCAITHETIELQTGTILKNLWSRSRSLPSGLKYETHTVDVPLTYTEVVYDTDPVTGSIFKIENGQIEYLILHQIGDPVLDQNGEQIYKHRKGDVVLDNYNNPVIESSISTNREIDLLLVDGKYYFATDSAFKDYRNEMAGILNTWITKDISEIQNTLLEQSKIYFYPKTTIGKVKIITEDQNEDYINAEQSLVIDLYVNAKVYNDVNVRLSLSNNTIKLLDAYISNLIVNTTVITQALKAMYGDSVLTVDMAGLGDEKNYRIITLASEHNRLCLKKILEIQQDNTLIIKEDVTINFHKVS